MVGAWCRGLVGLLLVAAAAAIELFDELPAGDDAAYQSDNDINTDLMFPQKTQKTHHVSDHDVMLYRILKALQFESRSSPELSVNRLLDEADVRPAHQEHSNGLMMKRYAGFLSGAAKMRFNPYFASRRAEKKKGAQICYFKLCAFGTPMY